MGISVQFDNKELQLQFSHVLPQTINAVDEFGAYQTRYNGSTTAQLVDKNSNILATATAVVYYKDQFNKKEGRRQALKKLQQQLRALGYPGEFLGQLHYNYENRDKRN